MAEKLTGEDLALAVDEANEQGAGIDPSAKADDKRAALQEFYDQKESTMTDTYDEPAEQEPAQVDQDVQENDPVADRIAKHGEASEEEKAAQQAAVVGSVRGLDKGPSQDDLNPAYAIEHVTEDPEADDN